MFAVWDERGIKPKVHVSQSPMDVDMSSKTARRKHGDYIDVLPDALLSLKRDVDVMFEAKMKEQAVLRYRGIVSGEIKTDRTTFAVPITVEIEETEIVQKTVKKPRSPSKKAASCKVKKETVKGVEKVILKKKEKPKKEWVDMSAVKAVSKKKEKAKKELVGMSAVKAISKKKTAKKEGVDSSAVNARGPTMISAGQPQSEADLPEIPEPSGDTAKRATRPEGKRTAGAATLNATKPKKQKERVV